MGFGLLLQLVNTDFDDAEEDEKAELENRQEHFAIMYDQSERSKAVVAEIEEVDREAHARASAHRAGSSDDYGYAVGFLSQLYYLAKRRNLDNIRNPGVFWIRLGMFFMLSFLIGTSYWQMGHGHVRIQDRISLLFYTAAFLVFMSIAG